MMRSKRWIGATGLILQVQIIRVSSDGLTPTRAWAVEVRAADGSLSRARVSEPRWVTDFWPPDAGQTVRVLVHERSGVVRFDMTDPQLSARAHDRRAEAAFEAVLEHPEHRGAAGRGRHGRPR
ncbi:MAG: hypothetical protein Q7T71_12520 [Herbiconiux sp.]|nr:hypothetical protein [Herbiconiux sp.]